MDYIHKKDQNRIDRAHGVLSAKKKVKRDIPHSEIPGLPDDENEVLILINYMREPFSSYPDVSWAIMGFINEDATNIIYCVCAAIIWDRIEVFEWFKNRYRGISAKVSIIRRAAYMTTRPIYAHMLGLRDHKECENLAVYAFEYAIWAVWSGDIKLFKHVNKKYSYFSERQMYAFAVVNKQLKSLKYLKSAGYVMSNTTLKYEKEGESIYYLCTHCAHMDDLIKLANFVGDAQIINWLKKYTFYNNEGKAEMQYKK